MPALPPRIVRGLAAAAAAALLLGGGLLWRRLEQHAGGPRLGGAVFVAAPAAPGR